jgi:hypothetical protein
MPLPRLPADDGKRLFDDADVAPRRFGDHQRGPVIGGLHGDQARHHHCDWCKSWLFTRLPPEMGAVNVRATMLDDASWFVPFIETQTAEMLPWAKSPATHSYERFPGTPEYPKLIAEFAALRR